MEIELNNSTAILSDEGWQLDQEVEVNNSQRVIRLLFSYFSCFGATVITFEVSNGDLCFGGGSENDFFIRIYNTKFELVKTLKDHEQEVNLIKQYRHYLLTSADDFTIHCYDIENNYEHISYVYDKENENVVSFEPFSHWRIASAGVGPYNNFKIGNFGTCFRGGTSRLLMLCLMDLSFVFTMQSTINKLAVLYQRGLLAIINVNDSNIKLESKYENSSGFYSRIRELNDHFIILCSLDCTFDIFSMRNKASICKISIKSSFEGEKVYSICI